MQRQSYLASRITSDCFGCKACVQVCAVEAIVGNIDREGFWYPNIDIGACVKCSVCHHVCPSSGFVFKKLPETQRVFACVNIDEQVLLSSSSGGVFRALAHHVLHNDGVVFGAMYDVSFSVLHGCAVDEASVIKFSGSKYVQSDIGNTYTMAEDYLRKGKAVLFSGTPCQIAGLYGYLRRDYDSLITVDFVCHGVPSPLIFEQYINYQTGLHKAKITNIRFKDKRKGWLRPSLVIDFSNGDSYIKLLTEDIYIKLWSGLNIISRPACHSCPYAKTLRESDVTIGDFWGIQNSMPDFFDEQGTSLVIVNSHKGEIAIAAISGFMRQRETTIETAMQWNLSAPTPVGANRQEFFTDFCTKGFEYAAHKYTTRLPLYRRAINRFARKLRSLRDNF